MTDANRKPWLTASEQIDHLKSRGVHFSLMGENDARAYLEKNSNYFRLRAYRLGFPKVEEGTRKGEYANLDFKMLVDLSIVDMLLRYELLPLTLDARFSKRTASFVWRSFFEAIFYKEGRSVKLLQLFVQIG